MLLPNSAWLHRVMDALHTIESHHSLCYHWSILKFKVHFFVTAQADTGRAHCDTNVSNIFNYFSTKGFPTKNEFSWRKPYLHYFKITFAMYDIIRHVFKVHIQHKVCKSILLLWHDEYEPKVSECQIGDITAMWGVYDVIS